MIFPKISIVVPSYNQGQYLEEALLSIIQQQYPRLELLVADGGSTDNSVDIIKKYEGHITWWVSEKDKGQSDAINKGLQRVTGEIVNWLCSDDLYTEKSLFSVVEHFSRQPAEVGLIHGKSTLFRGKKILQHNGGYKNPSTERNFAGMAFPQPSAFFLRKYLDIIGRHVNEELHYGMDYDLYSRLACVCRFVPVNDVLSLYRLHDNSKSVKEQHKFMADWSRVFSNLCRNLQWNEVLAAIKSSGFFDDKIFDYRSVFTFKADQRILNDVDKKRMLFYHYCYLTKALYWNGELDKAAKLLKFLKQSYPAGWLKDEKDIPGIMRKLSLPGFVLKTLKKVKRL
jgi:glycosyltransferase involved in cell wall biosynthesis